MNTTVYDVRMETPYGSCPIQANGSLELDGSTHQVFFRYRDGLASLEVTDPARAVSASGYPRPVLYAEADVVGLDEDAVMESFATAMEILVPLLSSFSNWPDNRFNRMAAALDAVMLGR